MSIERISVPSEEIQAVLSMNAQAYVSAEQAVAEFVADPIAAVDESLRAHGLTPTSAARLITMGSKTEGLLTRHALPYLSVVEKMMQEVEITESSNDVIRQSELGLGLALAAATHHNWETHEDVDALRLLPRYRAMYANNFSHNFYAISWNRTRHLITDSEALVEAEALAGFAASGAVQPIVEASARLVHAAMVADDVELPPAVIKTSMQQLAA